MGIFPRILHRTVEAHPLARRALLGCGAVSSVLYVATDIIASLRYPGYSFTDQEFSELTAEGAPTRSFMVALNGIPYTLLVTAFGVGVQTSAAREDAGRRTGTMLAGYAVTGMAGGVFFPMETRGTERTLRNVMHIPATAVMSFFILLSMGFGSRLLGTRFRYYSYGTMLTLLAFGSLASTQAGRLAANKPTPWMGIEERVNIYATMLWLAALSIALLRAGGAAAPGQPQKAPATMPGL